VQSAEIRVGLVALSAPRFARPAPAAARRSAWSGAVVHQPRGSIESREEPEREVEVLRLGSSLELATLLQEAADSARLIVCLTSYSAARSGRPSAEAKPQLSLSSCSRSVPASRRIASFCSPSGGQAVDIRLSKISDARSNIATAHTPLQSGLPAPPADRQGEPRGDSAEDNGLRDRAPDGRLGRSQVPSRRGWMLIRLLPSGAAPRTADLRRGGPGIGSGQGGNAGRAPSHRPA